MVRFLEYAAAALILAPWLIVNVLLTPLWLLIVGVGLATESIELHDVPRILLVLCSGLYAFTPNSSDLF